MSGAAYDTLGVNYSDFRRADPRIEARIWAALGDALSVLNVGAGTGSYEPRDREVIAIEPSPTMIAKRPPHDRRREEFGDLDPLGVLPRGGAGRAGKDANDAGPRSQAAEGDD
jgi:SAM-dependent methyltransferase